MKRKTFIISFITIIVFFTSRTLFTLFGLIEYNGFLSDNATAYAVFFALLIPIFSFVFYYLPMLLVVKVAYALDFSQFRINIGYFIENQITFKTIKTTKIYNKLQILRI